MQRCFNECLGIGDGGFAGFEFRGGHAGVLLEEFAEYRLVGEAGQGCHFFYVKACAVEKPLGFGTQEICYVEPYGSSCRFLDNARQIGSGNAQSVGIKFNVMRRAIIFHKQPAEVTIDCQCAFGVIG